MLHAIRQGKTKYFRRYLGKRDGQEKRVHEEDEITSTVLGPMEFLDPAENHRFWRELLLSSTHESFLREEPPISCTIKLWDRRVAVDTGNPIEPDAVVLMQWPDRHTRIFLIEFKWKAPLSGEDQLDRQWLHYLDRRERANALHFFIAPETSAGERSRKANNVWGDRLILLPWFRIRAALGELLNQPTPLGRWAALVDTFLKSIGIFTFNGFKELISAPPQVPMNLASPHFWHRPTFWSHLGKIPDQPILNSNHIFFESPKG